MSMPMPIHRITSLANPHIKAMRALHNRKHRRQSRLVLAEGVRIIHEAIDLGWQPQKLAFLDGRQGDPHIAGLIDATHAAGGEVLAVTPAVLAKISRKTNPQAAVACFAEKWQDLNEVLDEAAKGGDGAGTGKLWVALDRVRDPGNLGTIMRTLDAVAGEGIILIGDCVDAYSVESVRASMGACFNTRLVACSEAEFIASIKTWGGRVIGTSLTARHDYRLADFTPPLIVLMGNEQSGLTPALANAASSLAYIPMAGRSDSLNVAVATALMLYQYGHRQNPPPKECA